MNLLLNFKEWKVCESTPNGSATIIVQMQNFRRVRGSQEEIREMQLLSVCSSSGNPIEIGGLYRAESDATGPVV